MNVAVLTFEGFNELDSFIAFAILNRMKPLGWNVQITCPTAAVTSMNNLTVQAQQPLEFANSADIVLLGSGIYTREIVRDTPLLSRLRLNPERQLIGAQCSGTLLLAKLGYLNDLPACTDLTTKPWVVEAGVEVLNQPLVASGNVATAGGCLASSYLAAWFIAKTAGLEAASSAIHYVAPTGEKEQSVAAMLAVIEDYL
ncbi:MAG: DJ-1/PfpI family protein [Oceanospirillaceae bacterium]|nr:DJ-1/PfpI family protein [Oceanospirillaceae bacterium]